MESLSSKNLEIVYNDLKNIKKAIELIFSRTENIKSPDDFIATPWGMTILDSVAMVLIGIGENVKNIDKLTNKKLLSKYPEIAWKNIAGTRDVIAHHYFYIDNGEIYGIIKKDLPSLYSIIDNIIDTELFIDDEQL